jgi:hypothetical protein
VGDKMSKENKVQPVPDEKLREKLRKILRHSDDECIYSPCTIKDDCKNCATYQISILLASQVEQAKRETASKLTTWLQDWFSQEIERHKGQTLGFNLEQSWVHLISHKEFHRIFQSSGRNLSGR